MLDQKAMDFLENRGLDPELADRYGISTVEFSGRSVLCFAYRQNGRVVNEKFRVLPKERFWQHKGRKALFWNADAVDDPALETGTQALLITEGELDALAAIQSGFPLSVSVPDGAPPAGAVADESGAKDQTGRFEFLWHIRDRLKRVRRFIIAADGDGPGERLRSELIRRLSAGRCSFVEYPENCKDLNDVLQKHGQDGVATIINSAKQCPVKGLYKLSDYPDEGSLKTYSSGWPTVDFHFKLFLGEFCVVTGIPQHGKSSWTLNLLANLSRDHGFRSAIFSPEMRVVPILRDMLLSIDSNGLPENASQESRRWAEDSFVFIGAEPSGGEDDFDLDWIIDKATDAVLRDGIKVLLIDPWNEVEHAKAKGETLTEYVARGIRALKRFARTYQVAVIVVAHPTKMARTKDGAFEVPTLYDIADSAAWFNKCDHGIVIHRKFDPMLTEIIVVKSRFQEAGETGTVKMRLDRISRRFEPLQPT